MIVRMKKITLFCLENVKKQALEALRELGIMHICAHATPESGDTERSASQLEQADLLLRELGECGKESCPSGEDPEKLFRRGLELLEEKTANAGLLNNLAKEEERLEPWGNFSSEKILELRKAGIRAELCTSYVSGGQEETPGFVKQLISESKTGKYYLLISRDETLSLPDGMIPFPLPERSLSEVRQAKKELLEKELLRKQAFEKLACDLDALREYAVSLRRKHEFLMNFESMKDSGIITILTGYVPADTAETLQEKAHTEGWGLLIEDPAPDDLQVPTYIRKPKFLDIMDPLFDFIGVSPGYRENDVNMFFLLFFPVFFGMIIGDAVYGTLFILSSLAGKYFLLRKKPEMKLSLNLFFLLGCCSLTWGWLNGAWAGIPMKFLPAWMHGWAFLSDPSQSPFAVSLARKLGLLSGDPATYRAAFDQMAWNGKIVQYICFLLAAVHLSSARIFKFVTEIRNWRSFGHLGWAFLIVANFLMAVDLIVFKGTFPQWGYYLYGAGVLLVTVTISGEEALNLPFSLIGSFTDVLSYIRLYAVGLAGSLIAVKFNEMGAMLTQGKTGTSLYFAIAGMLLIALFGHILNIALSFLSVMVHGIRLNTLEFSNHVGMQWAGIKYHPFKKK